MRRFFIVAAAVLGGALIPTTRAAPVAREAPRSAEVAPAPSRAGVLERVGAIVGRGPSEVTDLAEDPLETHSAEDAAIAADGTLAVLDRARATVVLHDETGARRAELPLGVDDVGELSGVFVDGNDIYVERDHGPLVLVGDTSGAAPEAQVELPGRPTRDGGAFLTAAVTDEETGRAFVAATDRATGGHRFSRELRFAGPLGGITLLDSDTEGTIYVAALVGDQADDASIVVTCLDARSGAVTGSASLPSGDPYELRVLDAGGVLYGQRTGAGVRYERYDCS